jgi:hypothetical protein
MNPEEIRFDAEPPSEVKEVMEELARALNEEFKGSGRIQEILGRLAESGFDATLSLAVLVGLIPHHAVLDPHNSPRTLLTPFDREFLASLSLKPPTGESEGEG